MIPLFWTRILIDDPPTTTFRPNTTTTSPPTQNPPSPPDLWHLIDEIPLSNLPAFELLFSRRIIPATSSNASAAHRRASFRTIASIGDTATDAFGFLSANPTAFSSSAVNRRRSSPALRPPSKRRSIRMPILQVLDAKRSQSVGIFLRSLHAQFGDIERAIVRCDTDGVLSLSQMTQLLEMRATDNELRSIRLALAASSADGGGVECGDDAAVGVLDMPEQFLLQVAECQHHLAERIECLAFQADFDERCAVVLRKTTTVAQLCRQLLGGERLHRLFAIILTLGNYMNGGNALRGQADGFALDILGKLKDVRSNTETGVTLLHFVVRTFVAEARRGGGELLHELRSPVPEPADVQETLDVDFEDLRSQVGALRGRLKQCGRTIDRVVAESSAETLQPFGGRMGAFVAEARERVDGLAAQLAEARDLFGQVLRFFRFKPKGGGSGAKCAGTKADGDDCAPMQFFGHWLQFTIDFRDIWRKEIERCNNE